MNYARLVVVDVDSLGNWILETISVQEDVSVLSGAWVLDSDDEHTVRNLLTDRLILVIGPEAAKAIDSMGFDSPANVDAFLTEAKDSAEATRSAFESHVAEDAKKRSKLVEPTLTNWAQSLTLAGAHQALDSMGKQTFPVNTPLNFRSTLAGSNLIKILVDGWLSDERERTSRPYLNLEPTFIRLLPTAWTSHAD